MGDAIGYGQGGAHLQGPTCASRFKTEHHTAWWGILITGEDLTLAGLSFQRFIAEAICSSLLRHPFVPIPI